MKKLSYFGFLVKEPPTSLYDTVINLFLFQTLTFTFVRPHSASNTQRCIWPSRHVGGKAGVMLMKGTYIGSVSGEVLISDGGQAVTADDPVCAHSPGGPHLPNSIPLQKGRDSRSCGKWSAMRNQEVSDQKVCLRRAGDDTDGDGTDGTLELARISLSSQPGDFLLLLFFYTEHAPLVPLWQALQCWERGSYILVGTHPYLAWHSGLLCQKLGIPPSPQ